MRGIKQELQLHGQCQELALELLSEEAIAQYLALRLPGVFQQADALQSLAQLVHQRTEGNPLFMINVVNDLVTQGFVVEQGGQWELSREVLESEVGAPANIRELIERQLERLSAEEQQALEVASVAGAEFSAAVVTAGVDTGPEETETICDAFVRRQQFVQARGTEEWPDGTITTCYGFMHALYQEVLLERIPLGRRVRLHRQIGERKETGYREQTTEIAAELAVHFEQGRDYGKAVQYREQAARQALQRSANREAIDHLTKGLGLLKTLPDTPERTQQELGLQIALGSALVAIRGFSVPEVEKAYTRARELCQQVGETPQLLLGTLSQPGSD